MMLLIILVVLGYSLLAVYEFVPLYKQQLWRDLWSNAILGILSFSIAMLLCLNVKIPSPEKPLRELIVYIFGK